MTMVLAAIWGGCFGFAIAQFFFGHIGIGLGVLSIGLYAALWYIVSKVMEGK